MSIKKLLKTTYLVWSVLILTSTCATTSSSHNKRILPEKVIIGYATKCSPLVIKSVKDGVNVIIWSFIHVSAQHDHGNSNNENNKLKAVIQGGINVNCIEEYINKLDNMGYTDVIHLVSFGGWNGSHLDTRLSAKDIYNSWKIYGGHVFHGIDWDLEGNDDLSSPRNVFVMKCLDNMGKISELAKEDGYIVSIAPAESYLDFSTNRFSRCLNLTYPNDKWHKEFSYHGANAYAYLLAKYGPSIDMISIQLYESYTHAAYNITQLGVPPIDYLINFISNLVVESNNNSTKFTNTNTNVRHGYMVNFEDDKSVKLHNQFVHVPIQKLVIGLANGWALDNNEKHIYFSPDDLHKAYEILLANKINPKGFMFWSIQLEGKNDIYFAKSLNKIMHIRKSDIS